MQLDLMALKVHAWMFSGIGITNVTIKFLPTVNKSILINKINRVNLGIRLYKNCYIWLPRVNSLIFALPNSCSAGFKTPRTDFGVFLFFGKIFKFFFSNRPLHPKGFIWGIFSQKSCITVINLFCSSFSCLSVLQEKWDQKTKRGKPVNEKVC